MATATWSTSSPTQLLLQQRGQRSATRTISNYRRSGVVSGCLAGSSNNGCHHHHADVGTGTCGSPSLRWQRHRCQGRAASSVAAVRSPNYQRTRRSLVAGATLKLKNTSTSTIIDVDVPELKGGSSKQSQENAESAKIGTADTCAVRLDKTKNEGVVEGEHVALTCRGGKFFCMNLSTSGETYLQGAKLMDGVAYLMGNDNILRLGCGNGGGIDEDDAHQAAAAAEYVVCLDEQSSVPPSMEETIMKQMIEQKLAEAEANIDNNNNNNNKMSS